MRNIRNILLVILGCIILQSFYLHVKRETKYGESEDIFFLDSWKDIPNDSMLLSISKSYDGNIYFVDSSVSDSCVLLYGIFVDIDSGKRMYRVQYYHDNKPVIISIYKDSLKMTSVSRRKYIESLDYEKIRKKSMSDVKDIDMYIRSVPIDLFRGDKSHISYGNWIKGVRYISPNEYDHLLKLAD